MTGPERPGRSRFARAAAPLAVAFLAACGAGPTGEDPLWEAFEGLAADYLVISFEHRISQGGLPRGTIWADTAYGYEDGNRLEVRNLRAHVFDELGRLAARITGEEGEITMETEYLIVRRNVQLTMEDGSGRVVTTEELHFDCNSNAIWSDQPTTMVQDGTVLQGSGFRADCELQNLEVRNARGTGFRLE